MQNSFDLSFEKLPKTLAVMPVKGLLLLPGGQIPMNVFEPRYLNLIQDIMAAKDRMIGISLIKNNSLPSENKPIYNIGCAGRVTSFEETAEGRFLIKITGYCRYKIEEEVPTLRGYRRFSVSWDDFEDDIDISPNPPLDREKLISSLKSYAEDNAIAMDWDLLEKMPNFNIATFFAMSLPFSDEQRQKLLEAENIYKRTEMLCDMIKNSVAGKGSMR